MNEVALLAAIRDEPDDDLPRLAYADWCEEQGHLDRAELIRVQIRLCRGVRDRAETVALLCRLRLLSAQHRTEWLGPLQRWVPDATFDRGFINEIKLPARVFLQHAESILASHPISRLVLTDVGGVMTDLAACQHLQAISALDLHMNWMGDKQIAPLTGSKFLSRLRSLDLRSTGVKAAGLASLVGSPHLKELTTLNLADNSFEDRGVEALTRAMTLPKLARLDLSNNQLGSGSARALAACTKLNSLRVLRLAFNRFARGDVQLLARSPSLMNVQVIDVSTFRGDYSTEAALRREFGTRVVC